MKIKDPEIFIISEISKKRKHNIELKQHYHSWKPRSPYRPYGVEVTTKFNFKISNCLIKTMTEAKKKLLIKDAN